MKNLLTKCEFIVAALVISIAVGTVAFVQVNRQIATATQVGREAIKTSVVDRRNLWVAVDSLEKRVEALEGRVSTQRSAETSHPAPKPSQVAPQDRR